VRDGDWLQGAITDIKAQLTRMESKWNVSGNNDPETRANFTDGQPIMLLSINTIGGTAMWKVFVKSIPAEMHRGSGTGNSKKATAVKGGTGYLSSEEREVAALEKLAAAAEGAVAVQPGIQTEGPQAVNMHRTELLKQMQLAISMGGSTAQTEAATQKILQSIIEEVEGTLKHTPTDLGPRFDAAATRSFSPTMER